MDDKIIVLLITTVTSLAKYSLDRIIKYKKEKLKHIESMEKIKKERCPTS